LSENNVDTNKTESISDLETTESFEDQETNTEITVDASLDKAIETFRKLRDQLTLEEKGRELSEKELSVLDEECEIIRKREIITSDIEHEIKDFSDGKKINLGPPILTRFEKARIMGARALQLSHGAPTFIEIPESAKTSLDIAMEELDQRLIPISIRRVLPNGDFQNIPLYEFKNE